MKHDDEITIQLSRSECAQLMLMLGYAVGAAGKDIEVANETLRLVNRIGVQIDPNFVQYRLVDD